MVETTKLSQANTAKSLRTIVPIHIVNQMGLSQGDQIDWELDKEGSQWMAKVTKRK